MNEFFEIHTRDFPYSFETVWQAATSILRQKDKDFVSNVTTGFLRQQNLYSQPALPGKKGILGFLGGVLLGGADYRSHWILITPVDREMTRVELKLFNYESVGSPNDYARMKTQNGQSYKIVQISSLNFGLVLDKNLVQRRAAEFFDEVEKSLPLKSKSVSSENPSPKAHTLAQQLSELLERPPHAPEQPDKVFSDEKSGVTISYPAEFKVTKERYPVIAFFRSPSTGGSEQIRPNISVTCAPQQQNKNPSLESSVNATIAGTRKAFTDVSITGPFKITLAGVEAQMFVWTGMENGVLRQKAVSVAVCRNHVLGVVFHATPETFLKYWDAYRRMCNSCTLR